MAGSKLKNETISWVFNIKPKRMSSSRPLLLLDCCRNRNQVGFGLTRKLIKGVELH